MFMEYSLPANFETYGIKNNVQQFGNPLCDYITSTASAVPSVSPTTVANATMKGTVTLTGSEFALYADRFSHGQVPSTTSHTQASSMPVPVLGDSATIGVAFQETTTSTVAAPVAASVAPISGEDWTLVPPHRTAHPPRLRERPIGCKTIFVGGLPKVLADNQERAENILKAIFTRFDAVREVRVNQRQFAHVRFFAEEATVAAVAFSGFRLVLDGLDDKMHGSRLHVDYACNREDMREWEAHIRALERERRLQERMNPSSPTPITPFSDTEVSAVTDMIKSSETFEKGGLVLHTWLDRGELSRRNANQFYSLIQCANSHIRQLVSEKKTYQDELEAAKFTYAQRMNVIIRQLGQIQNILQAASKQKCWDHFSKPQRKNLETWRKQCEELVVREQNQHLESRQEDEMDLSDSDMDIPSFDQTQIGTQQIDEESLEQSSSLSSSVVPTIASSAPLVTSSIEKDLMAENSRLRDQVTTLQQQLVRLITAQSDDGQPSRKRERNSLSCDEGSDENARSELQPASVVSPSTAEMLTLKQALHGTQKNLLTMQKQLEREVELRSELEAQLAKVSATADDAVNTKFNDLDLKTIGLLSSFLSVHPVGASLPAIAAFLHDLGYPLSGEETEALMRRAASLFTPSADQRWKFDPHRDPDPNDIVVCDETGGGSALRGL